MIIDVNQAKLMYNVEILMRGGGGGGLEVEGQEFCLCSRPQLCPCRLNRGPAPLAKQSSAVLQ